MATAAEQAIAAAIASGKLPEYRHLFTRRVVTRVAARHGLRWRYEDFIREWLNERSREQAAGRWQEPTLPPGPARRVDILEWALCQMADAKDDLSRYLEN